MLDWTHPPHLRFPGVIRSVESLSDRERECWRIGWPTITATQPRDGELDWAVGAVAGDPVDQRGGDTRTVLPRIVAAERRPVPHTTGDDRIATVIVVRGTSELTAAEAIEWVIARFRFASWTTFDSLGADEQYDWNVQTLVPDVWYTIKVRIAPESEMARLVRPRQMRMRAARPDGSPEPYDWTDYEDSIYLTNARFQYGSTAFDLTSLREGRVQWDMAARTTSVTVNVRAGCVEDAEDRAVSFVQRLPPGDVSGRTYGRPPRRLPGSFEMGKRR